MSGPNIMAVVGNTDWLSTSNRRTAYMRYNSRLRSASAANISAPPVVSSIAGVKSVDVSALSTPLYFEVAMDSLGGAGRWMAGVALSSKSMTVGDNPISTSGYAVFRDQTSGSTLYVDGVLKESPSQSLVVGSRLGVRVRASAGACYVQFYTDGVAAGSEWPITAGFYSVFFSGFDNDCAATFYCDASELRHLPSGSQPWGAAAIIGDRSPDSIGYSPAATVFTSINASYFLDSYRRVASGSSNVAGIATCDNAPNLSRALGIYYDEWVVEEDTGILGIVGLVPRGSATSMSSPGATSAGFGFVLENGNKANGSTTAYGSAAVAGNVIGQIWQPHTGKVWWAINGTVQAGGDPEAGTGAAFTAATGDLVPALRPAQGRIRLCTHAREQRYRPAYAEARDGADVLPEQFFDDRLLPDTEISQEFWLPYPWGGSRPGGAPIGALKISNADGRFDGLIGYDLRDQELGLYEQDESGRPIYLAKVNIDSIEAEGETAISISAIGKSSRLEKRYDKPVLAIGTGFGSFIQTQVSNSTGLVYDVCQHPYFRGTLYDQGVAQTKYDATTGWFYANTSVANGLRRVVNPAGRHVFGGIQVDRPVSSWAIVNADFSAWAADNPTGWTVTETAPNALVTQNGSLGARFLRNAGAAEASAQQTLNNGYETAKYLLVDVSAYTSGDLEVLIDGGAARRIGINGTGQFYCEISAFSASPAVKLRAIDTTNLTVNRVQVVGCDSTADGFVALDYIMQNLAGYSAADYTPPDTLLALEAGLYYSTDRPPLGSVLQYYLDYWMIGLFQRPDGVLQFVQLPIPEDNPATVELTQDDLDGEIQLSDDLAPGLSDGFLKKVNYGSYAESEIAGSVSAVIRQQLMRKGNDLRVSGFHRFYAHAVGAPARPWPSQNDSVDSEESMLVSMYDKKRQHLTLPLKATAAAKAITPGMVIKLTMGRFGMSGGRNWTIYSNKRKAGSSGLVLRGWG